MSGYQSLLLEQQEGIAVLTLNLPDKRNAMLPEMTEEFPRVLEEVRHDPEVKALIITGAGSVFCAGGDLNMLHRMLGQAPEQNRREMGDFYRAYLSVIKVDVPVIAAMNGHAIGAGACFPLACDIRILAENARMGFSFLNLGLHPGMASTHLLPPIVGSDYATELLTTGRLVTAQEALAMRLVTRVVPQEKVMEEAMSIAKQMAEKPASSLRMAKRALARPKIEGLEEALDYEANAQMISFGSTEMRTAVENALRR